LRSECTRYCCMMPAGNNHLRPKNFHAFPFTLMCCVRGLPAVAEHSCRHRWPSSATHADCMLPSHGLRCHCSSSLQRLASAADEQRCRCLSENHTTTAVHNTS
jgi:hypothetical protein